MLLKICSIFLVFLIAGSVSAQNSTSTPSPLKECKKSEDCPKGHICEAVKGPFSKGKVCRDPKQNPISCEKNEDCLKGYICEDSNIPLVPSLFKDCRDPTKNPRFCREDKNCLKGFYCRPSIFSGSCEKR